MSSVCFQATIDTVLECIDTDDSFTDNQKDEKSSYDENYILYYDVGKIPTKIIGEFLKVSHLVTGNPNFVFI